MNKLPKDPVILLSFVNTELRDHFSSLDEFCGNYGVAETEIIAKLQTINYNYDKKSNQFR